MEPLTFEYTFEESASGAVKIPFDIREIFGKTRPPVQVTINDHTYRSTVAVYGEEFYVPVRKSNAEAAGVVQGEPFDVRIEADDKPRTVDVPDDLAKALADAGVRKQWDQLSFTNQREHVEGIEGAKRPDTRTRRIARAVDAAAGK